MLIIIGLGGTIYLNFFYGRGDTGLTETTDLTTTDVSPSSTTSQILPYGSKLNLKILDQDLFRQLRPFTPVGVSPEELGRPNPF